MDLQEDLIDQDIILSVQLPGGQETTSTVHSSKPVMDVLVTLCAQHHLIPSDHVLRLISANQNHIHFKPNSPIGSLEFEKVVLQVKGADDANRKKPHVPVATVRLMINYKKSHKAVLRVNPGVPLAELMPSVCEKCELNPDTTILLRTCQSEEPLDLTKTLNDYGIRELYAKDMKGVDEEQKKTLKGKNQKEKGNKGFFSLFKKSKKTHEQPLTVSNSASELNNHAVDVTHLNGYSSSPTTAVDLSKKRRAPQPPLTSQTCVLNSRDDDKLSEPDHAGKQGLLSRISSTESTLKRTKRRAPPPPCDGPSPSDADNKEVSVVENAEEEDISSDKHRACIAERFPAIAQVMTELLESLQARQQRALSSASSATSPHQTTEDTVDVSELSASDEVFRTPAGHQLTRNSCRREGLATFTVVPQRCQQSRKRFEAALARQATDTTKAGAEEVLSPAAPEDLKIDSAELAKEAAQSKLCRNGGNGLDEQKHLSEVPHLRHLEKQNRGQMDNKIENFESYSIHLKNVKKGELESFQRGFSNQESPASKMNNLAVRNAELKRSAQRDTQTSNLQPANKPDESQVKLNIEESLVKQEEKEQAFMETGEERNWIEEYRERRRKFGGGNDEGKRKLDAWGRIRRALRNTRTETIMQDVDDPFPPPPPPVYWHEGNGDGENDEEESKMYEKIDTATNTLAHDVDFDRWPSIEDHFDQEAGLNSNLRCKPLSHHFTQSNPEPKIYNATPEPPGNFLTSRPNSDCMPGSASDPCSPETMSLFALAVFQKAKHFRPGPDRNHSKRRGLLGGAHSS